MPSRNLIRDFTPETFYHVYNRGVEKRRIFIDDQDYRVFLGLVKKYLTGESSNKNNRHKVSSINLSNQVSLVAYCLMSNHFHLLLYQKSEQGVTQLLRRVSTGYVMYFNLRYKRVGGLFQGRFKASAINADNYLHHISRYIHMNPKDYKEWPYSSLKYYDGSGTFAPWVIPDSVLELFEDDPSQYLDFLEDYVESKQELDELKWQLANDM